MAIVSLSGQYAGRNPALQHTAGQTGELDRTAVVSMIDRIMVYEDNTVEIVYRWQDEFAWQMDIVRQAQIREAV